jgi:hypothetical protein
MEMALLAELQDSPAFRDPNMIHASRRVIELAVAEIRQWNSMKDDKLTPGQSLKLEVRAPKKSKSKLDKASEGRRPKHGISEHQRQHR